MSVFSYTFESILSIPRNKRFESNRKRGFCKYSAKARQRHGVALWWKHIVGNSQSRKLEFKGKKTKNSMKYQNNTPVPQTI